MTDVYLNDVSSTFSGWLARVDVENSDNYYEVTLPERWYENEDLAMQVCAYSGYYFSSVTDNSRTALINALSVAEKIWRWGDLALRYLIEEVSDSRLDEMIENIKYYGGTVTEITETEE